MDAVISPRLARIYERKISAGRSWPLRGLPAYNAKYFEHDHSGRMVFDQNNKPVGRPMEGIWFGLGMPLPTEGIPARLDAFNKELSGFLTSNRYLYLDKSHFHITFFSTYLWTFGETELPPHPMMRNPKALETFIGQIQGVLSPYDSFTFYFDRAGLMDNGAIIACGFPQDYPNGYHRLSAADLVRAKYLRAFPEVPANPDIYHITVGRLLTMPTREEHQRILRAIEAFNRLPLGTITFSSLKIGYEQRVLCPEIIRELDLRRYKIT